jgi:hypothetical protein
MTDTVPEVIAWPLIAFIAAMVAVRFRWLANSLYDSYFNNTLAWILVTLLFRQRAVEQLLSHAGLISVTTSQQMSMLGMSFVATEFMGFV